MNAESDVFLEILIWEKIFLSKEKVKKIKTKQKNPDDWQEGTGYWRGRLISPEANPATKPD